MNSFVIRIGGEAGWGIATAADVIAKVGLKLGYQLFSSKDYCSQIRGGNNFHTIRLAQQEIQADLGSIDLLLALDQLTITAHAPLVRANGLILYDDRLKLFAKEANKQFIPVPLQRIEKELNEKNIHNAVFLGAAAKVLGIKLDLLRETVQEYFSGKSSLAQKINTAAQKGYEALTTITELKKVGDLSKSSLLSGNDAITQGALQAKITFHAQYPMTPVSAVLHSLAKEALTNKDLTVIQPEDEIAAINLAIGASYAGARAMTATSGGGFSLMVEAYGLASMAEVPLVIIEGQRPGPATGLPTKTGQGDLLFVLFAAPGDFPRVIIAPSSIADCYTETKRAFYLAEKYQLPVMVLVDKQLAESYQNIDLKKIEKEFVFAYDQRINILEKVPESKLNKDGLFQRYAGHSLLRTLPGTVNGIYTCSGDEHDEVGEITESAELAKQMNQRRMKKLDLIEAELPLPALSGPAKADLTIVGWGSSQGVIAEVVEKLNQEGRKVNFLSLKYLCPFHDDKIKSLLSAAKQLVLIEGNYTGQLGKLIAQQTGVLINDKILKYNGQPFEVEELYQELKTKWFK